MSLVPLLLVPAGVVVAANASGGTPGSAPPPTQTTANGGVKGTPASAPGASIGDLMASPVSIGSAPTPSSFGLSRFGSMLSQISVATATMDRAPNSSPIDAEVQSKLDTIKQYGEAAYNKLSAAAKKAAAKAMNDELGIDPPLTGEESWGEILKRSEPYAAAKAGSAIGEAFGGPAGAALGQMVGKYLGVKLESLLSGNVDSIKAWFRSKWADIESTISDAVDDAVDKVESWFDDIF